MFGNRMVALCMLGALSLAASGALAAEAQYRVSASIVVDGAPLASPSLVVKQGTPAEVRVSGDDGYRLRVVVNATQSDDVEVSATMMTSRGSVDSVVISTPGVPVAVASGDIALELTVEPAGG